MDHVIVVLGPGFEQQHRYARILAQSRGDDSARAARSDDDVVETFLGHDSPFGRARSTSQNLLFDVIGHSMGGFIGMSLAAQYPRRCGRLVLLDAMGEPEQSALPPIVKSVSRLGRTYPSVPAALSYMQAARTITP